jgi:hypothetical protein
VATSKKELRLLRQAAMGGDHSAAKALLKMYGHNRLALEIKAGRPFTNRVRTAVSVLTAGTGTGDAPANWEYINDKGEIENDVLHDPPPRKTRVREIIDD